MQRLQTEMGGGATEYMAVYWAGGTMTLNADGTGAFSGLAELGSQLNVAAKTVQPFAGSGPSSSTPITWSYSGDVVNSFAGPLSVVAGGRLLIGLGNNSSDNTVHLLLFTRPN